jgi:predicted dienelactone hydrolase
MIRAIRWVCAVLVLTATTAAAEIPTGVRDLQVPDAVRPLTGLIWYPAQSSGSPTLVGDNRVYVGTPANRDAEPASGEYPLVILSHGWGGNDFSMNWLAADLASRGMIVVAINHPGSTAGNITARAAMEIWNRPADISRTITQLIADAQFGRHIDRRRIAVIGHSLGGATALAIAGARVDRDRIAVYCDRNDDEGCADFRVADLRSLPKEKFEADGRDPRVSAVVAMAPGLTPAMTQQSLSAIAIPVLVIGGEVDRTIPIAHLSHLATELPRGSVFETVRQAAHFDFLRTCKPGGAELLREDKDDPVCDGVADRTGLHTIIAESVSHFLEAAWSGVRAAP